MTDAQRIIRQQVAIDAADDLARMVLRLDLASPGDGDFEVPLDIWAKMVSLAKVASSGSR